MGGSWPASPWDQTGAAGRRPGDAAAVVRRSGRRRGHRWVLVPLALLIVLGTAALAIGGLASLLDWRPFGVHAEDRSAPVVLHELRDLARYRAASGEFSQVVDVERDVEWVPDFLAGERTLLVAVGTVDAEIDFAGLGPQHIETSADGKNVTIHLPPAQLSPPRLDFDQTHVVSRDRGVVNRVNEALGSNAGDDQQLYQRATRQLADAAAATELRQRAEANTTLMLQTLLHGLGYENVEVVYDLQPPE